MIRDKTNLLLLVSRFGLYVSKTSLINPWGNSSLVFANLSFNADLKKTNILLRITCLRLIPVVFSFYAVLGF